MKKSIYALADNHAQADRIVEQLLQAGFHNEDISLLMADKEGRLSSAQQGYGETGKPLSSQKGTTPLETKSKAAEGAATGATLGGIIGGSIGLLTSVGTLTIPGLGLLVAAGPLVGALTGSAVGGATGLALGGLIGYGIPEYEAKKLEEALKKGNILISVPVDNDQEVEKAKKIFSQNNAKEISVSSEQATSR